MQVTFDEYLRSHLENYGVRLQQAKFAFDMDFIADPIHALEKWTEKLVQLEWMRAEAARLLDKMKYGMKAEDVVRGAIIEIEGILTGRQPDKHLAPARNFMPNSHNPIVNAVNLYSFVARNEFLNELRNLNALIPNFAPGRRIAEFKESREYLELAVQFDDQTEFGARCLKMIVTLWEKNNQNAPEFVDVLDAVANPTAVATP